MNDVFILSDSGECYCFDGDTILGLEKNRYVRYSLEGRSIKKSVVCYGGIKHNLHDGKTLIALNKSFYIKE